MRFGDVGTGSAGHLAAVTLLHAPKAKASWPTIENPAP